MNLRNLTWKLNWYRQGELEGSLLLGKLVRIAEEPSLVVPLTRHCADEARHACLWAECVAELELPVIRILRSYQSFYAENGGIPGSVSEALALTHVFEKRVWKQFQKELHEPGLPAPVTTCLRTLLDDERQHLDWVHRWLSQRSEGPDLLRRFARIDENVYAALAPFEDCIWNIPGLGEELQQQPPTE
jgi:hypothetical protein